MKKDDIINNKMEKLINDSFKFSSKLFRRQIFYWLLGMIISSGIVGIGFTLCQETGNWWFLLISILGLCLGIKMLYYSGITTKEKLIEKYLNHFRANEAILMINPYFKEEKNCFMEELSFDCNKLSEKVTGHYLMFKPFEYDDLVLKFKVDEHIVEQYQETFKNAGNISNGARYILCNNLELIEGEYEITSFREIFGLH